LGPYSIGCAVGPCLRRVRCFIGQTRGRACCYLFVQLCGISFVSPSTASYRAVGPRQRRFRLPLGQVLTRPFFSYFRGDLAFGDVAGLGALPLPSLGARRPSPVVWGLGLIGRCVWCASQVVCDVATLGVFALSSHRVLGAAAGGAFSPGPAVGSFCPVWPLPIFPSALCASWASGLGVVGALSLV